MALARLRECIDAPLRVGLPDGRVIIGRFACVDKQRNVLLIDALEVRKSPPQVEGDVPESSERHLGIVLIPRRHIVSCHAIEIA